MPRNNGQNDHDQDHESNSSGPEEGEITEREVPPLPPLKKPFPGSSLASRRYRQPPLTTRPPIKDMPYMFSHDIEQPLSQREHRKPLTFQAFPEKDSNFLSR